MLFQNLTRGIEIGANCYLLTLGNSRILLDAGLHPKGTGLEALPAIDGLDYDSIDAVVLTHAHLDHAGALPVVQRHHPSAQVYMTAPTFDLAEAMLHNSVSVMTILRDELGITEYPLFTRREIDSARGAWRTAKARRPFPIGKPEDEIVCEFFNAGHILGSVGVLLRFRGSSIFYSGDVHFEDQTLSKAAHFPEGDIDVLIVESTRGAEERPADYSRPAETERLGRAIEATLGRGGAVLIPVFAIGKTQETLTVIDQLKQRGAISDVPVFLGGLSTKMTSIYDRHAGTSHRHHGSFRILEHMDLVMSSSRRRSRKRREIPYHPGSIYALSSGMMTEKTLSNSFARNILPDPCNSLLFVGYAAPDSPGGRILASAPGENVHLETDAPPLPLACEVKKFDFSGHSTRESIRNFVTGAHPRQVFLVHGDETATRWIRDAVRTDLPACEVVVPDGREVVALKEAS